MERRSGPGADRPPGIDEAAGFQLLVASGPERIPSLPVAALVPGDVLLEGMQRPVRSGIGQVEEEGHPVAGRLGHHVEGMVGDHIRVIPVEFVLLEQIVVSHHVGGLVVRTGPTDGAEELVEASLGG